MFKNLEFIYAPDEGGSGGGAGAAPAAPATPPPASATPSAPPSAPSSTPPPATPAVSPTPGAAPTGATSGAPSAPASPAWFESLRKVGIPVGKDETETISTLKRIHDERQAFEHVRPLLPHVQAYLAQAQEFNAWKASQAKAPKPAPAAGQNPADPWWKEVWNPPEFNRNWMELVTQDAAGNFIAAPGAPPDVVMKVQAYRQFQNEKAKQFLENPYEFMAPMQKQMEARARAIAEETMRTYMDQTQARQNATNFIEQNQSWLFDVDPATKMPKVTQTLDPQTGQWRQTEVLSPWGERMRTYADGIRKQQEARGYFDQREIEQVAYAQVQRDYAVWENQEMRAGRIPITPPVAPTAPTVPAKSPQDAANQAFLDANNPAAAPGKNGQPAAEKPVTSKNLRAEMLKAFKAAGLTAKTINN